MSRVIVAVSGGIAAYKTCDFIRLLKTSGHDVKVIMTACAKQFVGAMTLSALSGYPVYDELLSEQLPMLHIELAKWAEYLIVAPATAATLSALAQGNASSLLSAVCLATTAVCHLVPAMNQAMWHHPATQANITRLQQYGYAVMWPDSGLQACGDNGMGRMPSSADIYEMIFPTHAELAGVQVLLTAGPTYEKLDPIRYIGNFSSGKMGYALASEFSQLGARVHVISGPTQLDKPAGCRLTSVTSAQEMLEVCENEISKAAIFVSAAAVANYSAQAQMQKLKSKPDELVITLQKTTDILQHITQKNRQVFCVGFCAETEGLIDAAKAKRIKKGCHTIIANQVSPSGFPLGGDENEVVYINEETIQSYPKMNKQLLANKLVQRIVIDYINFRDVFC